MEWTWKPRLSRLSTTGPCGNLNRHLHQLRLRLCKFEDPARHAGKTLASVLEDLFSEPAPVGLQHTDMVRLRRPIDAHLELFLMHVLLLLANV